MDIYERIKISDLSDSDVVKSIFDDINALDNEDNRQELISMIFKHAYEEFFHKCMVTLPEMDDIINSIGDMKEFFINCSGLSIEEVDRYFELNNISIDKIVNSMLEKVDTEIEELELELNDVIEKSVEAGLSPIEYVEKEIEKLEEQKSREIKEINEQIAAINAEIERRKYFTTEEEIREKIAKLREEQKDIVFESRGYPSVDDDARYHEINSIVRDIEKQLVYRGKSVEELNVELVELKEEQAELYRNSMETGEELSESDQDRYHEINKLLEIINIELVRKEKNKFSEYSDDEIKQQIINLKEEQAELYRNSMETGEELSERDQDRYHEINRLITELENELLRRKSLLSVDDLKAQIERLREEQAELYRNSMETGEELSERDQDRYHEINRLIAELEKELSKRKNIPVTDFSGLSDEDLRKKLKELEGRKKDIQSSIDKQVTELKKKIEKLKRLEKLKKFSENRIIIDRGGSEEQVVDKKERRKDILYKCLSAIGGFGLGFVLSTVPGVGTIRMIASGTKLAVSGINFVTKKFPEGRVARIVSAVEEKINSNEKINNFKVSYPGIINGINTIKNKIKEILANKYVNYFINGVSAGYLTGNFIEMITGKSIAEHLKNSFNKTETVVVQGTNPGVTGFNTGVSNPVPEPEPIAPVLTIDPVELKPGEVFDISGLSEGFVSSTAQDSVNLLTSVGKEVVVDKFVTLPNGEVMVHFKQINGAGYAWFNKSVVEEHLTKIAEAAVTSGRSI